MRKATDMKVVTRIHPEWRWSCFPVKIAAQLTHICMVCFRKLENNHSVGEKIPVGPNQSHGLCLECLPGWGKDAGLSEKQVKEIIDSLEVKAA